VLSWVSQVSVSGTFLLPLLPLRLESDKDESY